MRRLVLNTLLAASTLALVPSAWAGEPPSEPQVQAPVPEPHIYMGTVAQNCQWPTNVGLFANNAVCSGTLVHPEIVVTAAHCPLVSQIRFGENLFSPVATVPTEYCVRNPGYQQNVNNGVNGTDYAFCKLAFPVNDVPITPPMYGCELELLVANSPTVIAGFGVPQENGNSGTKRWSEALLQIPVTQDSDVAVVGSVGNAACGGDSGGPAYFQMPDGSWHAFGIVSGGPPCGEGADTYSLIHRAIPWIEQTSGIDITPCHDVDGTWNPTAACGGFATDPLETNVSWQSGCATPLSGPKATCGPAFGSPPDVNPPTVAITNPGDGEMFDPGVMMDVTVDANDPEFGIVSVGLTIDGMLVATDEEPPYVFADATFGMGVWELVAIAEDYSGNVGESEVVTIYVGTVPGDGDGDPGGDGDPAGDGDGDPGGAEGTDTGVDDTTTGDEGTTGPAIVPVDEGCACATASTRGGPIGDGLGGGLGGALGFGFALLVLAGLRRRS